MRFKRDPAKLFKFAKREGWTKKASVTASPVIVTEPVTAVTKEAIREQNKVGRPTKYREELNDQVFKMALLGLTDEQMADVLDVETTTLDDWKVRYPEFYRSLKRGKNTNGGRLSGILQQGISSV